MASDYNITSVEALEDILGTSMDFVRQKVNALLDEDSRAFIEQSPLVFVATHDGSGNLDVSPKGDAAGFAHIESDSALLIPERPGNKLAFGFRNILESGRIGLIFVIPGQRETLRVNGTATLHNEPALLQQMGVKKKPALLYTRVTIDECFFHCGKAMIRSKVWQEDTWPKNTDSLMVKQAAKMFGGDSNTEHAINESIEENYRDELY